MQIRENWTFEASDVAQAFDQHVREQLPWYDLATGAVAHVARHYIPEGGLVYDFGASTGNIGRALAQTLGARHARLIPVEKSMDMAALYSGPGAADLLTEDATRIDLQPFDLGVCFLTLMFMTVPQRAEFMGTLRAKMRPGGALIVFDKTEAATGYPATVIWRLALAGKVATGCDPAEIVAKELSLSGVQRPLNPAELGPGAVEFFRFGDFAGWLIEAG
jgi:tRNA (cmo5U34)-methyltransferase